MLAILASGPEAFCSVRAKANIDPQEKVSLAGTWKGVIDSGGVKLRLVSKLTRSQDGSYQGVLQSLDQSGDLDLPIDTIVVKENSFRFEMKSIRAVYEGTVNAAGTEIIGRWIQGGSVILIFRREDLDPKSVATFKRGTVKLEPCNLSTRTTATQKYEGCRNFAGNGQA
jgi:hypothetical protein